MEVEVSWPALGRAAPLALKICRLGFVGGLKFARFKTLKISRRNCTLKPSENLLIRLFLNSDASRFERPGPMRVLRPALPSLVAGTGKAKHSVLM